MVLLQVFLHHEDEVLRAALVFLVDLHLLRNALGEVLAQVRLLNCGYLLEVHTLRQNVIFKMLAKCRILV